MRISIQQISHTQNLRLQIFLYGDEVNINLLEKNVTKIVNIFMVVQSSKFNFAQQHCYIDIYKFEEYF